MRQWARTGSRPSQPADQRYESAYLFGAICPVRGTGAALAMPYANTEAMQVHLDEIARTVAKGAHAVLLLDRAGWHTTDQLVVPKNLTLVFLPSRAPELNPVENIWQYLRANWLSNRVFETYDAISTRPATPGTSSSPSQTPSPRSAFVIGPTSVNAKGRWYKYFIIIPNMLGNGLSSSPSNMPEPYNKSRFPQVIPTCADQNAWAQSRNPMDMMIQGCSMSLFQAWQQWLTMSS